jgi:uncharacterized RDD family membrane protein YckC
LPESGPRSIARFGRRLGALVVDWAMSYGIAFLIVGPNPNEFVILGIFGVLQIVVMLIFNGSIGHLIFGMRVVPLVPGYLGVWRPILRTILLMLFIPAVVYDRDQRGLHDRWAGTILVRR